jgi:hypothetical protein
MDRGITAAKGFSTGPPSDITRKPSVWNSNSTGASASESFAKSLECHRNGERQLEKKFPARAPETTRDGACAPQKLLMIREVHPPLFLLFAPVIGVSASAAADLVSHPGAGLIQWTGPFPDQRHGQLFKSLFIGATWNSWSRWSLLHEATQISQDPIKSIVRFDPATPPLYGIRKCAVEDAPLAACRLSVIRLT